jgi:hypothetical protein
LECRASKDGLSNGVFNTFKVTDSGASTCVTAVCYGDATNINFIPQS